MKQGSHIRMTVMMAEYSRSKSSMMYQIWKANMMPTVKTLVIRTHSSQHSGFIPMFMILMLFNISRPEIFNHLSHNISITVLSYPWMLTLSCLVFSDSGLCFCRLSAEVTETAFWPAQDLSAAVWTRSSPPPPWCWSEDCSGWRWEVPADWPEVRQWDQAQTNFKVHHFLNFVCNFEG